MARIQYEALVISATSSGAISSYSAKTYNGFVEAIGYVPTTSSTGLTPTTGGNIGQWLQAKTKATGAIIEGVPNWVLLAGGGVGVLLLGGDGGGRRR